MVSEGGYKWMVLFVGDVGAFLVGSGARLLKFETAFVDGGHGMKFGDRWINAEVLSRS